MVILSLRFSQILRNGWKSIITGSRVNANKRPVVREGQRTKEIIIERIRDGVRHINHHQCAKGVSRKITTMSGIKKGVYKFERCANCS